MSFQTCKSFVHLRKHNLRYFGWKPGGCDCPIDCQVNNTVKAQKSMKNIAKIVHLHWFNHNIMKLREYFLYAKKTKITTLFNNLYFRFYESSSSTFIYALIWTKTAYPCGAADTEQLYSLRPADTLQNGATLTRRRQRIKTFLFSLCTKSFLVASFGSQWDSHKPPGFHPKYLKLCLRRRTKLLRV